MKNRKELLFRDEDTELLLDYDNDGVAVEDNVTVEMMRLHHPHHYPSGRKKENNEDDSHPDVNYVAEVVVFDANKVSTREDIFDARRFLYVSHFFAQFSEIAWQFCLALFLAACTNYQSLILVSSYGMTLCLAVAVTGGTIGRIIDASPNRLHTVQWLIGLENISVLLATASCYILLSDRPSSAIDDYTALGVGTSGGNNSLSWLQSRFESVPTDPESVLSLLAIHILGATAQVMDQAFLVAMERDWVVVLSRSAAVTFARSDHVEDETGMFGQWLSDTNVAMKQIDLSCKVAGPAVAGFLIPLLTTTPSTFIHGDDQPSTDFRWACLVVGALNLAAIIVEYICTARIYRLIPALAIKGDTAIAEQHDNRSEHSSEDSSPLNDDALKSYVSEKSPSSLHERWRCWLPVGMDVYMQQSSAWGGLGLAFLYMNALTFGNGIMTAYLLHRGMRLEAVGIVRGFASAIGLVGTFAYHFSAKRLSLEDTGLWSVSYQASWLAISMLSLSINDDFLSLSLLISGICLSRIGLWVFDIAVTQMQQHEVPSHCRGQVGGVQQSLNACFNLCGFTLGVLFPNPKNFAIFVSAGFLSVCTAALLFIFGIYLPRRPQSSFSLH